jgi:hypothetical protein
MELLIEASMKTNKFGSRLIKVDNKMYLLKDICIRHPAAKWMHTYNFEKSKIYFSGGLLGQVGKFPARYIGGALTGQSLGGIFASGTNIIFIAIGGGAVSAAFYSFLMAVVFLGTALASYVFVTRLEFFQHFASEEKTDAGSKKAMDVVATVAESEGERVKPEEDAQLVPEFEKGSGKGSIVQT